MSAESIMRYPKLRTTFSFILMFLLSSVTCCFAETSQTECVILLHGLARTSRSMNTMESALKETGYSVVNHDYPSRKHRIEDLAAMSIPPAIKRCQQQGSSEIHFVTHSMGGILARYYLQNHPLQELGKMVMLSPPNQGSEVVDTLGNTFFFKAINGPAGNQLGTEGDSLPRLLTKPHYPLGVITGDRTINFILSMIIPGRDDGKVSTANAQVDGMADFLIVHASHPFIMKNATVIEQTIHFLKHTKFKE